MTKNFKSFLGENSLYSNDAERAALLIDKDRVAAAFMFNFLGMLGMINATSPTQRGTIIKFLRKDKQVRLGSIGDDNHDISLSVKLAHEAGFFKQDITANEITKFLFKLKSGQIDSIDSNVVAGWLRGMVPSFRLNIKDAKMRQVFDDFVGGGGTAVDVSRFAVQLKKRVNTVDGGGDYQKYAKRFFGLTEITPQPAGVSPMATAAVPAAPTVPTPIVDPSAQVTTTPAVAPPMNYYQRQKLKKLAALTGAPVDPAVPAPTAPKLGYYQRQKQIKQAAAQQAQQAIDDQAAIDQKARDAQAAIDQKEREAAQTLVASNIDIDQLIDEGIKLLVDIHMSGANQNARLAEVALEFVKTKYNLADTLIYADKLPDAPRQAFEAIYKTVTNVENYIEAFRDRDTSQDFTPVLKQANAVRKTKYTPIGFLEMFVDQIYSSGKMASYRKSSVAAFINAALEIEAKDPLIKRIINIGEFYSSLLSDVYKNTVQEKQKQRLISFIVSDPEISSKMLIQNTFNGLTRSYPSGDIQYGRYYDQMLVEFVAAQPIDFLSTVYNDTVTVGASQANFIELLIVSGDSRSKVTDVTTRLKQSTMDRIEKMAQHFIQADLFSTYEASIVPKLFEEFRKGEVYDTQAPQNGGMLFELLHDRYAADLVDVGFEKSLIGKLIGSNSIYNVDKTVKVVRVLNIDLDQMMAKFPNDEALVGVKVRRDGVGDLDTQVLVDFLESRNSFYSNLSVAKYAPGDKDKISDALAKASLIVAKKDTGFDFDTSKGGDTIMNLLSSATSETVLEWMRFAKSSQKKYIMSVGLYKSIRKDEKGKYVEVLTGIILDTIGTDVEDYVNDIIDGLAPHVVQKIRMSLVGSQVLIDEISSGEIKPFDKIDNNRLKQLFLYNDIDLSAIVSGAVSKKKKGETYTQFFARAKATIARKGTILPEPEIAKNDTINVNALNKTIIQRDHAGKHGDVFPKILNVYDGTTDNPLFDDFRKNKFGDGTVEPAYHGTGGVAASMILRYGFRVIKPSDSGVVGRMLGDGIYFSNKVDKALQYVSNGGYSRRAGQKGYLFSMDVNLGEKRTDYQVAGVPGAGGGIRSPEWCVFNPPAQLRIQQVYEVELATKQNVDKHLAEGVYCNNNKVSTFKNYITEQLMDNYAPTTTFIFRDGMIPIVDVETNEIEYVDFQEALQQGKLPEELYDITSQGPAVVFPSATMSEVYDERYAHLLVGDGLVLYAERFVAYLKEKMLTTT